MGITAVSDDCEGSASTMKYTQTARAVILLGRALRSAADAAKPRNLRQRLRVAPWFQARGDKTLRLDYDLEPDSIVFDVGGYEGNWASDIFAMYRCQVYVFEPVPVFHDFIAHRFRHNREIRLFPFGLAADDQTTAITIADDASSTFSPGTRKRRIKGAQVSIQLKAFSDFLKESKIDHLDLLKINIEGGEYDLLDHILAEGLQHFMRNIQVQFHDFVPDALPRMTAIQRQLANSHHLTYQFPFVWENWQHNGSPTVCPIEP